MTSVTCHAALQSASLSGAGFGHVGVWTWPGGAAQHAAIAHIVVFSGKQCHFDIP